MIPHGAFDYLTRLPEETPLPEELAAVDAPVILCFGLIRPYKGVDILIEAFRQIEGAELWIVGRPLGMPIGDLREQAGGVRGTVRFVDRFVADSELPAFFRRADVVALPYRDAEQSGVLFTALAFGKAVVMTDVGGFGEVAATGRGRLPSPPNARMRSPAASSSPTRPSVSAWSRRRGGGRRPLLLGRDRRPDPRPLPVAPATTAIAVVFWVSSGLLVYTMAGYPLALWR